MQQPILGLDIAPPRLELVGWTCLGLPWPRLPASPCVRPLGVAQWPTEWAHSDPIVRGAGECLLSSRPPAPGTSLSKLSGADAIRLQIGHASAG